tara:strand:- start:463 stop:888 length:426 start_codon:yes stop_codon:yes gene_type:complete
MANEVTKIGKKLDKVVADMKKLAPKYVKATGDKKQEILEKLKKLTSERDDLKNQLSSAVNDLEKSVKLQIESFVNSTLDEIRFPQTDFTRSQLVPRMEGMVDRQTYKRFTDSLDDLLDDWYMEGFEKDDVLAFMKVIIPSS